MTGFVGEVRFFPFDYAPADWLLCNGAVVSRRQFPELAKVLGNTFGSSSNPDALYLPNLQGRVPVGVGAAPGLSPYQLGQQGGELQTALRWQQLPRTHNHSFRGTLLAGDKDGEADPPNAYLGTPASTDIYADDIGTGTMANGMVTGRTTKVGNYSPATFSVLQPYLPLTAAIATTMDEAPLGYVGELCLFAGAVPPDGWLICDGRLLEIASDYQFLYTLIGTIYGGDGVTTFALPNLCGRATVSAGVAFGQTPIPLGLQGGAEQRVLTEATTPPHQHAAAPTATVTPGDYADSNDPNGNYFGWTGTSPLPYTSQANIPTGVNSVQGETDYIGENQPVPVVQPYLGLNYIICFWGVYPPHP